MTTKICLSVLLVFIIASCNNNDIQEKPQPPETPKALEDNNSFDVMPKGRRSEDLCESLYDELLSKDAELKKLEVKIEDLNRSKHDSTELFDKFDGKIQSYFRSVNSNVSEIQDSLLRDKIKLLIASHLEKYNARTANHNELLKTIAINDIKMADLHTVLKIVKTLPVIEKYQQNNVPSTKQLEGFISQQNQAIRLADTLIKK
jgi:hypothetical protein